MFLGLGQLQLPGYHGNHQSRTACTLREEGEGRGGGGGGGENRALSQSVSKTEELVNQWLLAGELAQMIEGSEDKYEDGVHDRRRSEWGREERIRRDRSVPDPHFFMLRRKPSLFSLPIHLACDPLHIGSI